MEGPGCEWSTGTSRRAHGPKRNLRTTSEASLNLGGASARAAAASYLAGPPAPLEADMTALAPPSSCRMRASTLTLFSMAMVGPVLSPMASTRIASAVLAASTREILPLFLGAAWPMSDAW